MKSCFVPALLLAANPQWLLAQSSTHTTNLRPFFVEVRSSYNEYVIRYTLAGNRAVISSLPLTVGYYLTPRLAIQLSGAYGHKVNDWQFGTLTIPDGVYSGYGFENHAYTAIPVTVRYVLNKRQLQSRLQVDALLGLAWAHDSFHSFAQSTFTATPHGSIIPLGEQSYSDHGSQFFATVGLSLRWRFYRKFEAIADYSWNRNLDGPSPEETLAITGSRYGLTPNNSFGLRYRFNLRKPAPTPAAE